MPRDGAWPLAAFGTIQGLRSRLGAWPPVEHILVFCLQGPKSRPRSGFVVGPLCFYAGIAISEAPLFGILCFNFGSKLIVLPPRQLILICTAEDKAPGAAKQSSDSLKCLMAHASAAGRPMVEPKCTSRIAIRNTSMFCIQSWSKGEHPEVSAGQLSRHGALTSACIARVPVHAIDTNITSKNACNL